MHRIHAQLIRLASEILSAQNMPPADAGDYTFYNTTPKFERIKMIRRGEKAHEQCRQWAIHLRNIANQLSVEMKHESV
jgi:hypothetical protein